MVESCALLRLRVPAFPVRLDHDAGGSDLFVVAPLCAGEHQAPHHAPHMEAVAPLATERPCRMVGGVLHHAAFGACRFHRQGGLSHPASLRLNIGTTRSASLGSISDVA